MKKAERSRLHKIVERREKFKQTPERSLRNITGRVMGAVFSPVFIFVLGLLPFFAPLFIVFLLLIFILKPSQEVKAARPQVFLWTIFVLPVLIAGFSAPFRGLTLIMGGFASKFPVSWSGEMRMLLAPMPSDLFIGVLGVAFAMICGYIARSTLRTQRQQLANIPTATVRSAAIGLSELKGIARIAKGPAHKMRVESFHPGEPGIPYEIPRERILQVEERWTGNAIGHRKMWRTFYLEDGTGRILVDPLGVEFWKGDGSPYFEPLRKINLSQRIEQRFVNPLPEETRWLEDNDPVYVIGSVETNVNAPLDAKDAERLVIRPSSEQRKPGILERFMLPGFIGKNLVSGRQYYHLFFLSDSSERDLTAITKKAEQRVLVWTLVWLVLSLVLALRPFQR